MLQREMDFQGRVDCESPNDVSSPCEAHGYARGRRVHIYVNTE